MICRVFVQIHACQIVPPETLDGHGCPSESHGRRATLSTTGASVRARRCRGRVPLRRHLVASVRPLRRPRRETAHRSGRDGSRTRSRRGRAENVHRTPLRVSDRRARSRCQWNGPGCINGFASAVVFVPVVLAVVRAARASQRARLGTLVAAVDRRAIWSILAAALALTTLEGTLDWFVADRRVDAVGARIAPGASAYRDRERTLALVQGDPSEVRRAMDRALRRGSISTLIVGGVLVAHAITALATR